MLVNSTNLLNYVNDFCLLGEYTLNDNISPVNIV
jgi:hypothetical protein